MNTLMKTMCAGLTVMISTETALKIAELLHVDVKDKPPAIAAILPRPVLHLDSTGDGELPVYVHTGEPVTLVSSIAPSHGLLTAASSGAHVILRVEGGRITFSLR